MKRVAPPTRRILDLVNNPHGLCTLYFGIRMHTEPPFQFIWSDEQVRDYVQNGSYAKEMSAHHFHAQAIYQWARSLLPIRVYEPMFYESKDVDFLVDLALESPLNVMLIGRQYQRILKAEELLSDGERVYTLDAITLPSSVEVMHARALRRWAEDKYKRSGLDLDFNADGRAAALLNTVSIDSDNEEFFNYVIKRLYQEE